MNVDQQQFPPPPTSNAFFTHQQHQQQKNFQYDVPATTAATATLLATTAPPPQLSSSTTYVTIGLLPPPPHQQGYSLNSATATASPAMSATTTSSFKTTPLLPMPTLEDIECGGVGTGNIFVAAPETSNMLPPGILKYSSSMPPPSTTTTTTTILMGSPPTSALQLLPPAPATIDTVNSSSSSSSSSSSNILKTSNNKLLGGGILSGTQQPLPLSPPPPPPGILSTSSTIASNIAAGSNNCSTSAINNAGGSGGAGNSSNNANSKRYKTKRKCCTCFGAGAGGDAADEATTSTKYSTTTTTKKTKKTQTLWAGLLTNLGICALLLAYTLLGSFIFLTIENEDSTSLLHQQRTLASTRRVAMVDSSSGGGSLSKNIYHTQPHHLDNGTVAAVSSSSSLPSSAGTSTLNDNHEFGITDSQLALSADTFDVRQRTIENIWDITVSLNILYKENWTKLAALEIAKFQDQLVKRLNEDALLQLSHDIDANGNGNSPATEAVLLLSHQHGVHGPHEWNFAKAFLYSLTVLTTIGYGNIAPKTTLGRLVTLAYAILGIPLTLVYLSSTGGILAKVAREVFSKALCCCLCSNCGYCCYDEKRMAEKERRMKRKRQQEELRKQQAAMQEPYYVRSGSLHGSFHSPDKHTPSTPMTSGTMPDIDSLSASESRGSMHGLSILAPILLCLSMMIIYILFGAVVLYRLENWPLLDGVYFCFMSLSTIGFGDMVPGLRRESTTTTWFCSIYIMSGMALTAMCFNVIHEEIVHRIKIVVEFKKDTLNDEQGYYMAPPPP